jgi:hypothetical protein
LEGFFLWYTPRISSFSFSVSLTLTLPFSIAGGDVFRRGDRALIAVLLAPLPPEEFLALLLVEAVPAETLLLFLPEGEVAAGEEPRPGFDEPLKLLDLPGVLDDLFSKLRVIGDVFLTSLLTPIGEEGLSLELWSRRGSAQHGGCGRSTWFGDARVGVGGFSATEGVAANFAGDTVGSFA